MTKQTEIDGVLYYTASKVEQLAGISRQTLWRWRQEGKVPSGHRFRNRQILFTIQEVDAVVAYANRVEPSFSQIRNQLSLFVNGKSSVSIR